MTTPDFKARARELMPKLSGYHWREDNLSYDDAMSAVSTALEQAFEEGRKDAPAQVQARYEDFESWMAENHIDGSGEYEVIWDWFQERQLKDTP